jgi:glycosyltransferase involved in cell wall biosynthesis
MALQEAKAPLNPNTILVPHGVDYEHFSKALRDDLPVPDDMKDIPHPILGFFGLIRDWVDLDLLAEVARARPAWHLVLLGDSTVDLSPYRNLPNMHFLGRKSYADLPAYCKGFDIGLIPFKVNELTRAVNPIKLREYLAAGLPVVSTPLPEVMAYDGPVRVGDSAESFVDIIGKALGIERDTRPELSGAMAGEGWLHKLNTICRHLSNSASVRRL